MNLEEKITSSDDLLKVYQIEYSAFFKECENLYGPLNDDTFWKYREQLRSVYIYDQINIKGLPFHFLHLNHENPNLIAFTANDKIGKKDGKTFIKPGKYLAQHTNFNNEQIKSIVTEYKYKFVPPKLYLTETPEDIVNVYENGPNSCMKGKGWDIKNHPVRVYQGPDTKLAYIKNKSGEGYTARTIIRTDKNPPEYINVYGDTPFFEKALKGANIVKAQDGLRGCRLPVVWKEGQENKELLMPYLDGNAQTGYIYKKRNKRDFVYIGYLPNDEKVTNYYHIKCTQQSGVIIMPDLQLCSQCNQRFFQEDAMTLEGHTFCPSCLKNQETVKINEGMKSIEQHTLLSTAIDYSRYIQYKEKWYTQAGLIEKGVFYNHNNATFIPLSETRIERNSGDREPLNLLLTLHTATGSIEYFTRFSQSGVGDLYLDIKTMEFYTKNAARNMNLKKVEPAIQDILKNWKKEFAGPSRSEAITNIATRLEPHEGKREFLTVYCTHYNQNGYI